MEYFWKESQQQKKWQNIGKEIDYSYGNDHESQNKVENDVKW